MNAPEIERGDTVRIESKESEYDGHTATVYRLYDSHVGVLLDNTESVIVDVEWEHLTKVEG